MYNKLPPPKTIGIDVDGTLYNKGSINHTLIEWIRIRKSEGFEIMLWSMRGKQYAKEIAEHYEIKDLFDVICSKPGYIVDDMGWSWIRGTEVVSDISNDDQ